MQSGQGSACPLVFRRGHWLLGHETWQEACNQRLHDKQRSADDGDVNLDSREDYSVGTRLCSRVSVHLISDLARPYL